MAPSHVEPHVNPPHHPVEVIEDVVEIHPDDNTGEEHPVKDLPSVAIRTGDPLDTKDIHKDDVDTSLGGSTTHSGDAPGPHDDPSSKGKHTK